MPFLTVPGLSGRRADRTVPMRIVGGRYELDLPAIAAALTPGALFVLTNPHNPTGRVFSVDELLALRATCVDERRRDRCSPTRSMPRWCIPATTHRPYAALSVPHSRAHDHRDVRLQGLERPGPRLRAS